MAKLFLLLMLYALPCCAQTQPQTVTKSVCVCQPQTEDRPNNAKPTEGYWRKAFKPDVLPVWIGGVAALLASIYGLITLRLLRTQTKIALLAAEAAKTSADAYVLSERPFVMIETRGNQGFEFWAINYGKSPAQIIFSNPVPFVDTPLLSDVPKTLHYGSGFDNPNAEQINVQWIPPQGCYPLGSFDPEIMNAVGPEETRELITATRVMIIYSALKYRGIDGKTVYTSTYCYRKYPSGLKMWGGYGWNQYT